MPQVAGDVLAQARDDHQEPLTLDDVQERQ